MSIDEQAGKKMANACAKVFQVRDCFFYLMHFGIALTAFDLGRARGGNHGGVS